LLMTGLVLLTALVTAVGTLLRRGLVLAISLILSTVTVLAFIGNIGNALNSECQGTLVEGGSCISGIVGRGTSGLNIVTWGFDPGFYTFIASSILVLGTLVLHRYKQ